MVFLDNLDVLDNLDIQDVFGYGQKKSKVKVLLKLKPGWFRMNGLFAGCDDR